MAAKTEYPPGPFDKCKLMFVSWHWLSAIILSFTVSAIVLGYNTASAMSEIDTRINKVEHTISTLEAMEDKIDTLIKMATEQKKR